MKQSNYDRMFNMPFKDLYPNYVNKAKRKNRTKAEVDEIISYLFGYSETDINQMLDSNATTLSFFKDIKQLNPNHHLIKGVVCGIRVEDIEDPIIRNVRYLDKLIDELAKGKSLEQIKR